MNSPTEKWKTVGIDFKEFSHRAGGKMVKFVDMVDEATRFVKTHIVATMNIGQRYSSTATEIWEILLNRWISEHGAMDTLRFDAEGAFRSFNLTDRCGDLGIEPEMIAGEAHWQMSVTENTIQDVEGCMFKLQSARPDLTAQELISLATVTHNQLERHKGYSPAQQWALGKGQTWNEGLNEASDEAIFLAGLKKQQDAETAYLEHKRASQIDKAKRARSRTQTVFQPGQAVMVWRRGTGTTRREGRGSSDGPWAGQWKGVGRMLAQQSKIVNGEKKPKPIYWVVIGGRLLRCAPEHLRLASTRETLLDEVGRPTDIPWSFDKTSSSINKGEYIDLLNEPPPTFDQAVDSDIHIDTDDQFQWPHEPIPELEPEFDETPQHDDTPHEPPQDDARHKRRLHTDETRRDRERTPPRVTRRITEKSSPCKVRFEDTPDRLDTTETPETLNTHDDLPDFPIRDQDADTTEDERRDRSRSPPRQGLSMLGFTAVQQGSAYIEINVTPHQTASKKLWVPCAGICYFTTT